MYKSIPLFFLLASFSFSSSLLANEKLNGTLLCQMNSSYVSMFKDFELGLDHVSVGDEVRDEKEVKEINLSESECEDGTNIYIDLATWNKFKDGKNVSIFIEHFEPDVEVKGWANCRFKAE